MASVDLSSTALISLDKDGNKIDATKKYSKLIKTGFVVDSVLDIINNGTILGTEQFKLPSFKYLKEMKSGILKRGANAKGKFSTIEAATLSKYNTDVVSNINIYDLHKAVENFDSLIIGKKEDKLASEIAQFQNNLRNDLTIELINASLTKAAASKVYSTVEGVSQPASLAGANRTTSKQLVEIKKGKRVVEVVDLDTVKTNRLHLVTAASVHLSNIGTNRSLESKYPFATGIEQSNIVVLTTLEGAIKLKDEFSTILTDGAGIKGITKNAYGFDIVVTKNLPADTEYIILSKKAWDHSMQPITDMNKTEIVYGGVQADSSGSAINLPLTTARLINTRAVSGVVLYDSEIFVIKTA